MSQLYLWQAQELELTRKKGPGLIGMGLAKAEAGALPILRRMGLYSAFCQPQISTAEKKALFHKAI